MSSQTPSNSKRARRASRLLVTHAQPCDGEELQDAVTDLLTDLAHLADRERFNLAQLIDRARGHYNAETDGAGLAFSPPYCDECGSHHLGSHHVTLGAALDSAAAARHFLDYGDDPGHGKDSECETCRAHLEGF